MARTWGGFRGHLGTGHGVGLRDTWGDGAGTWGGFRGPVWWNETFRVTLGDTGLGHGVGLGDHHGGMRTFAVHSMLCGR